MRLGSSGKPLLVVAYAVALSLGGVMGFGLGHGIMTADSTAFGESTAAWAQALLSAGAIGVAIWVDRGSSRRQQAQFEHSEVVRKRAIVDAALAATAQAQQVAIFARDARDFIRRPGPPPIPYEVQFDNWRDELSEGVDALRILRDRVTDPLLLVHLTHFISAARVPPVRGPADYIRHMDLAADALEAGWARIRDRAHVIAEEADVEMEFSLAERVEL